MLCLYLSRTIPLVLAFQANKKQIRYLYPHTQTHTHTQSFIINFDRLNKVLKWKKIVGSHRSIINFSTIRKYMSPVMTPHALVFYVPDTVPLEIHYRFPCRKRTDNNSAPITLFLIRFHENAPKIRAKATRQYNNEAIKGNTGSNIA